MINAAKKVRANGTGEFGFLELQLRIDDMNSVAYLAKFKDEETREAKAVEAIKIGVVAIQSASPTLDLELVQAKFSDVDRRMQDTLDEFQKEVGQQLERYFNEGEGVVPRSIETVFGEEGELTRTLRSFFDPSDGRVSRLMEAQIGPNSTFGRAIDPENSGSVVSTIEAKVQELVQRELDEVLRQFSLDENESAMSRLSEMLGEFFQHLNQSLGIKAAVAEEASRGTQKGVSFERDVYDAFAELGRQLEDETEFVHGTPGKDGRTKKGDFVVALGVDSGAPGTRLVVEVKDQPLRMRDAIDEMRKAKENRDAVAGIFVFSRGCEPAEAGDFRRVGEDFFVTVAKEDLEAGRRLPFLESAYKIARTLAVTLMRVEATGELDAQRIRDHVDSLAKWSDRIADMVKKARTIQRSGEAIEKCIVELQDDLDGRLASILSIIPS